MKYCLISENYNQLHAKSKLNSKTFFQTKYIHPKLTANHNNQTKTAALI